MKTVNQELNDENHQEDSSHLEEQRQVHAVAIPRPERSDKRGECHPRQRADNHVNRFHLEQQGAHQQRCFHSFARDHQQREQEHARECRGAGLHRRRVQATFNVFLDPLGGSPHVDGQRRDRHSGDQSENAFPQSLVSGLIEQPGGADAENHRKRRCPNERRESAPAAGSCEGTPG